jgi:hypothetical protein
MIGSRRAPAEMSYILFAFSEDFDTIASPFSIYRAMRKPGWLRSRGDRVVKSRPSKELFMSWQSVLATVAEAVLKAVNSPAVAASPSPTPAKAVGLDITATGLTAFVNFVGPIVRIVEGKGTFADDEDAANAVMNAIATFDPAAAPVITMIELAEPTFEAIVDLAKAGKITGGYPDIVGEENSTNFKDR